jgi:hypothetical protein
MKVFIGYERSGVVRRAFRAAGHEAISCDLRPAVDGSEFHILGDARTVASSQQWDLAIVHPPCTFLSVSGQHWNGRRPGRQALTDAALEDVRFWFKWAEATGHALALENPVGIIATKIRPASQYIQPYQFGHDASKKTGLWLVGLPPLQIPPQEAWFPPRWVNVHTSRGHVARPRWGNQTDTGQNRLGPSDDRADKRAETYAGIAAAMVAAWGNG